MRVLKRHNLLFILLLSGSASLHAEVYKYVRNGVVTYSESKPRHGAFEKLHPECFNTYIGCDLARSDWSRVKLNRDAYKALVDQSAQTHQVDPALIRAVIHAESNFDQHARSRAGAEGLMQLMPDTQKRLLVKNPFDARENIDAGTRLLKRLLKRYGNSIKHVTAAYNAGINAVQKYRGIPPYEETQNYVRRVAQLYSRYQVGD